VSEPQRVVLDKIEQMCYHHGMSLSLPSFLARLVVPFSLAGVTSLASLTSLASALYHPAQALLAHTSGFPPLPSLFSRPLFLLRNPGRSSRFYFEFENE
jgi:hypothetical protein